MRIGNGVDDATLALREWVTLHGVKVVAHKTGVSEKSVCRYMGDSADVPIEFVRRMQIHFPNVALRARVLCEDDLDLVTSERVSVDSQSGVFRLASKVGAAAGKLQGTVVRALEDGKVTPEESREVESDKAEVHRSVDRLAAGVAALKVAP